MSTTAPIRLTINLSLLLAATLPLAALTTGCLSGGGGGSVSTPDCEGRECGDDGVGGSCGTCDITAEICSNEGLCVEIGGGNNDNNDPMNNGSNNGQNNATNNMPVDCGGADEPCCEGDCDDGLACAGGSCQDVTGMEGGPCYPNDTCDPGLSCEGGACVASCEGDAPAADMQDGVCGGAQKVCEGTDWVEPDYSAVDDYAASEGDAHCDGLDNDCDGEVDEDCTCAPDDNQTCGSDVGECQPGFQTCTADSEWGECMGGVQATTEACNGRDDDCDGETDEAGDLTPPQASKNMGLCAGQLKTCEGPSGWVDPDFSLIGGFEAREVTCDGADNDCDGFVDEGIEAPLADRQDGVCNGARKTCDGSNGFVEPDYTNLPSYEATETSCDSLDNDCDGAADANDDNLQGGCVCDNGTTQDCGESAGECEFGEQLCADNTWGTCMGGQGPVNETCNGLDDNCNNSIDDGVASQAPDANKQDGVCAGQKKVCGGASGWQEPNYSGINRYQSAESACDGYDNDCDGMLDGADTSIGWPDPESGEDNDTLEPSWPSRARWTTSPTIATGTDYNLDGNFNSDDADDWFWADMFNVSDRNYFRCTAEGAHLNRSLKVRVSVYLRTNCDSGCDIETGGSCCGAHNDPNTPDGCDHTSEWTNLVHSGELGDGEKVALDLRNPNPNASGFFNAPPCFGDGSNMYGRLAVRVRPVDRTLDRCNNTYRVTCRLSNSP